MAKFVSSSLFNHCSVVARRAYASVSQSFVTESSATGSAVSMMKKGGEESKKSDAWVPDPVTGYYKPEGHGNQIDPVELRQMLLKNKNRQN